MTQEEPHQGGNHQQKWRDQYQSWDGECQVKNSLGNRNTLRKHRIKVYRNSLKNLAFLALPSAPAANPPDEHRASIKQSCQSVRLVRDRVAQAGSIRR